MGHAQLRLKVRSGAKATDDHARLRLFCNTHREVGCSEDLYPRHICTEFRGDD